jgi:plastocyanin
MDHITRNNFHLVAVAVLAIVVACGAVRQAAAAKAVQEGEPVEILILKSSPTGITPDSVTVKIGETIRWLNKDPEPVKIKFKQPLGVACSDPVNFYADLLGNYETKPIMQGGTASICLINAGTYDYEVRRQVSKGGKEPYEELNAGRIIVK